MNPFVERVQRELRRAIVESGLSFAEVGRRLGLSRNAIPDNLRNPSSITVERLAEVLDIVGLGVEEFLERLSTGFERRLESLEERIERLEEHCPGVNNRRSA